MMVKSRRESIVDGLIKSVMSKLTFSDGSDDPLEIITPIKRIHLSVQQRNARKCVTILEGIDPDIDLEKLLRILKKHLACNGVLHKHSHGPIFQFQGDHRAGLAHFIVDGGLGKKEEIKIHGG